MKSKRQSKHKEDRTARLAEKVGRTDIGLSITKHRWLLLLALATVVLKSLIFAPISWWPLAFFCLVPWIVMVGAATLATRVYAYSFLLGFAYFIINVRWMYPATGAGYVALAFYLSLYFPLMACAIRSIVRRRRWPLGVALPIVWVGGEMLRAVVISGFPWFYLSHSLAGVLILIQTSDLVGAYGVSFMVAAFNGAVADVVIAWFGREESRSAVARLPRIRWSAGTALSLLLVTIVYGRIQLGRDTMSLGPKVAVLQGDFISSVDPEPISEAEKKDIYFQMLQRASSERPDLYLIPESPWAMVLNPIVRDYNPLWRDSFSGLRRYAMRHQAYIVTGCATRIERPDDLLATTRAYNSAAIFKPDGSEPGRYDKVHLVPFGEFVPFRFGRLRPLYFFLNRLMPFSGEDGSFEYSLFHGDGFHRFEMTPRSRPDRTFRFGVPICYEDVMPYVAREFVRDNAGKAVDFLLNISNDGWFGRGIQQPQHMNICVFRAIENRVGIARAVNTGVSTFIDPNGAVHDVVKGDTHDDWPGIAGYAVANVLVDSRHTVYSRFGDWFAWACVGVWGVFYLDYLILRARERRDRDEESG